MGEVNPLEKTLESTSGKAVVGTTLTTVIVGAILPFIDPIQEQISKGNYVGILVFLGPLVLAVFAAVRLHKDSTDKKVAMINSNSLPMSNQPKP